MDKATKKKWHRSLLQWYLMPTRFHEIHRSVQKLLVEHTDRQAGDLISLLSFLESRLKTCNWQTSWLYHTAAAYCVIVSSDCTLTFTVNVTRTLLHAESTSSPTLGLQWCYGLRVSARYRRQRPIQVAVYGVGLWRFVTGIMGSNLCVSVLCCHE
jgi:hypothetical protein